MAFVEHKPSRSSVSSEKDVLDTVRAYFKIRGPKDSNKNSITLTVYIGMNVASKIHLLPNNKVSFYYDDENPRRWLIKKSLHSAGYKVIDASSQGVEAKCLRFQMTWKVPNFKIEDADLGIRTMNYELYDGGILLNADVNVS